MIARPKTVQHREPVTLAMTAPAVRMLAVDVWISDGESAHTFYPVLALVAGHLREYSRPDEGLTPGRCYKSSPDPARMEALRWEFEGTSMEDFDAVILTGDYGLCRASQALSAVNESYRLVVTDWPAEEDEERLAPIVADLADEIRARTRRPEPALA